MILAVFQLVFKIVLERKGFELPFIVKLSQNLMLYDLLDKVYFNENEVMNKLWP